MENKIIIGEVIGVHGVRGELKIRPLTEDPGRFYELDTLTLANRGKARSYAIEMIRIHKGNVLLSAEGITTREQAEKLRGALVEIDREDAVELAEDEFFVTDLIGMTVVDGAGAVLGTITGILDTTGSVDTVEIQTPARSVYVPFRKEYFKAFDFEEKKVTAEIPAVFLTL
jgi:16S rRNA processing protein RimM